MQQCYFSEMGNQLLYSTIKQSIGETVYETSATYKNSSYTIFIRFHTVDGTRKADVYGQFNGTNLSEGCPAAEGSYTDSFDFDSAPISKNPTGGTKKSDFTSSDLSGGGSVGGIISRPSYKPCDHPSYKQYDDVYHKCAVEDCQKHFEHEYPITGLTAKCTICGYIKGHTCTFDKNNICTQCGEERLYNFKVTKYNRAAVGYTGSTDEVLVIPETFVGTGTNGTSKGLKYKVVALGSGVFQDCTELLKISIPSSVKEIGDNAFRNCPKLSKVEIGHGVEYIKRYAFYNSGIQSVNIPSSVTRIDDSAFSNCKQLENIEIPDSVTVLGHIPTGGHTGVVFSGCTNLKSVTLGTGLDRISRCMFSSDKNLMLITYTGTISQWQSLPKEDYWKDSVPKSCIVHCTDGDISI